MFRMYRFAPLLSAAVALALATGASAITLTGSGFSTDANTVSATANIAFAPDTITVTLANTTPTTRTAGDLLTGFDLTVPGVTAATLTSGTTTGITVNSAAAFTTTGTVNLLTAGINGGPTWSVTSGTAGALRLDFNPDAAYGILGPPTGGTYAAANSSINGNPGHNPYAHETATFTLSAPGVTAASTATGSFLFGTDFATVIVGTPSGGTPGGGGGPPIPEPASLALLPLALIGLGLRKRLVR